MYVFSCRDGGAGRSLCFSLYSFITFTRCSKDLKSANTSIFIVVFYEKRRRIRDKEILSSSYYLPSRKHAHAGRSRTPLLIQSRLSLIFTMCSRVKSVVVMLGHKSPRGQCVADIFNVNSEHLLLHIGNTFSMKIKRRQGHLQRHQVTFHSQ